MRSRLIAVIVFFLLPFFTPLSFANNIDHLQFTPPANIANGKHVVLISGDEEYRSEESMPMLAKILSQTHGFNTTVLFSIDKKTGAINPNETGNIPHLASLETADLIILATRWRVLPGKQLQYFLNYLNAGKPIIALRTATHPFNNNDFYGNYDWQNFGLNVVGENWLSHHGEHKVQGGRGVIEKTNEKHPILNQVADIFTQSDIYGIENLDQNKAVVLLHGAVTESLDPTSAILSGKINQPMMPLAWVKYYPTPSSGKQGKIFATTAGAAVDFLMPDLRRLVVNATYYLLNLKVPNNANVDVIDTYEPSFFGFQEPDYFINRNLRVSDFVLGKSGRSILTKAELEKINSAARIKLKNNDTIVLLGNGLAERMLHYGFFETELQLRNPDKNLTIRTLAKPGDAPGFRPHPSRNSQWAFPGAEKFNPELSHHSGEGHHPSSDEWLYSIKPDVILAFFGFNESFRGAEGLENYRAELAAFIDHTLANKYNGLHSPKLALVSPIAFQDLSQTTDLPAGKETNENLLAYRNVMEQVAAEKNIHFVDLYSPTKAWFQANERLTINGAHLNQTGYKKLAPLLADSTFGKQSITDEKLRAEVNSAILDKNWYWFQTYQTPNGVHVDGRRFEPYGVDNYPEEAKKLLQLTQNRDEFITQLLNKKTFIVKTADATTQKLSPIKSNVTTDRVSKYLYADDALASFTMAPGYKIQLFASETDFPNLANPAQLTFDNRGRLWVSTLPSYPHYKPGDTRPNDKILIYEDTNNDGKADKEIIFAEGLHLPIGFEITEFGVYVSQAPNLILLQDTDGDDKADTQEIILSGFDTHDTHHAIGAFETDPSGSIIFQEGVFLHSNIETAYGPIRAVNGGFYRFTPRTQQLQRMVQTHVANPWGVAYDQWGQDFFLMTSGPEVYWMLPVEIKTRYGQLTPGTETLIEADHRVRPTSGLEFVSSRHFPDEVQGDFILNNVIGFLGAKQHRLEDFGTGYKATFRQDLFTSNDPNFRPVDLEFSPDGSLYVVDWHNQLIGHMQHNARDPLRDHAHGRIYRITYPERPLIVPLAMNVPANQLFDYLKLPESRIRANARRALRALPATELNAAKTQWIKKLNPVDIDYEHHLLEALWASNNNNDFDRQLTRQLLHAKNYKVRAAAVRQLRNHLLDYNDAITLLTKAANDSHGRVRLEAIAAASWLDTKEGLAITQAASQHPTDAWMQHALTQTIENLGGKWTPPASNSTESNITALTPELHEHYNLGKNIYQREGFCATCHQADGQGLPVAGFPPLANSEWVNGNPERLIDITLHGIMGPLDVNGVRYDGHVPMTPFKGMLSDEETAAVLTYIRNSFGNQASIINSAQVKKIREGSQANRGFWSADELNKKYPATK